MSNILLLPASISQQVMGPRDASFCSNSASNLNLDYKSTCWTRMKTRVDILLLGDHPHSHYGQKRRGQSFIHLTVYRSRTRHGECCYHQIIRWRTPKLDKLDCMAWMDVHHASIMWSLWVHTRASPKAQHTHWSTGCKELVEKQQLCETPLNFKYQYHRDDEPLTTWNFFRMLEATPCPLWEQNPWHHHHLHTQFTSVASCQQRWHS